jgi:hypothetical protein
MVKAVEALVLSYAGEVIFVGIFTLVPRIATTDVAVVPIVIVFVPEKPVPMLIAPVDRVFAVAIFNNPVVWLFAISSVSIASKLSIRGVANNVLTFTLVPFNAMVDWPVVPITIGVTAVELLPI